LLVLLGFLVLYPVAMLLLGALTNTNPVVDGFGVFDLSLANFVTVLGNPNVHNALVNSLIACAGGTALAVVLGLTFSWIVVRRHGELDRAVRSGTCRGRRLLGPVLAEVRPYHHHAGVGRPRLANRSLLHERAHSGVRHVLRSLRLPVHRLGAAQHGSEPGGG